ncbi:MAG: type IV conjugative transfer system protein TraE [Sphingomonadales bacterium]|jgi:conjugal transfer pilus assembly protein TraE|nr:type IV conjugative transfer system protein TraE [Sphingomonadales bacterium]
MDVGYSQAQAQKILKQRNMLAMAAAGFGAVALIAGVGAASRDREVILQPVHGNVLAISSEGVSREYLELVTRDAAIMMFNRNPASLEYWMEAVLKIVHPSAYGQMKGELIKMASDQRGSSVAYFFTIERLTVDPDTLTSEVSGVVHTMVGRQEVSALHRTFRFGWSYTGLELRLLEFGAVAKEGEPAAGAATAAHPDSSELKVR